MYSGMRRTELGEWIAENMPDLSRQLCPMEMRHCRELLNRITGLKFDSNVDRSEASKLYLAALKKINS